MQFFKRKLGEKKVETPGLTAAIQTQKAQLSERTDTSTHSKGKRLTAKNKRKTARASRQNQRRKAKGK